jgi:hypothetical protein
LNLKGRGFDEMMRWEEKEGTDGKERRKRKMCSPT